MRSSFVVGILGCMVWYADAARPRPCPSGALASSVLVDPVTAELRTSVRCATEEEAAMAGAGFEDRRGDGTLDARGAPRSVDGALSLAADEPARAIVGDHIATAGWMTVLVTTNVAFPGAVQAEAAGMAEGRLTAMRSAQQFRNTFGPDFAKADPAMWKRIDEWREVAQAYARSEAERTGDPFWRDVLFVEDQLRGLHAGLAEGSRELGEVPLTEFEVWIMTADGDLGDLTVFLATGFNATAPARDRKVSFKSGSCSGLVRWTGDELFAAHDTWSTFSSMLRAWKTYDFNFGAARTRMSFSSYPGTIVSGDDFYQISTSGLVAFETTNDVYNQTLYEGLSPKSVFEYARAMVASRNARSAREWAEIFSRENNGCYNNDWIITDYNKFTPGAATLPADTVVVLSQIPHLVRTHDRTPWVLRDGFFGSYNIPSDPEVWAISGYASQVKLHGDWFTYEGTPRAPLFRRLAPNVTDLDGMRAVMLHNDFRSDPEARCECHPLGASAENAIAARSDLNPASGSYPFPALGHRAHGAIDSKIASSTLLRANRAEIISGPAHQGLPVFDWNTAQFAVPQKHEGQPDKWDFPWLRVVS